MTTFFLNREGGVSVIRVGILIAVLGVLGVVAGVVIFQLEHQQRKSPLNIAIYPGASEWRREDPEGVPQRTVYYQTTDSPEDVAAFYQAELDDHLGQNPLDPNRETCVRVPASGQFADFEPGTGNLPFYYRCAYDNAFFDSEQLTIVEIQPGVRSDETGINNEGITIIKYDQRWSR
ncbi:MAG: hypothetical protein ACOCXZ_01295 [Chloroflexota bacterium]